jgi:hypothetical protein
MKKAEPLVAAAVPAASTAQRYLTP